MKPMVKLTKEGYETVKKREKKRSEEIEKAGGFLKAPKWMVDDQQYLANLMLHYEIDNNLLPNYL